ncbi:MAG: ferredoxin--nitrite reductase [Microcoleaceae cyanobacterium]
MTSTVEPTETLNKFERFKAEKDGLAIKAEIEAFARMGWEAMDETDRNHRLKWLGVFFRPVTPGKFMLRLRLPNGVMTAEQMVVLAEIVQRYGDDGSADITTRQNLQLRGIRIEDIPDIFRRMDQVGLTSIQSGMDNVRNITGSPVAGLDADELYDTRELVTQVQDMITNNGEGNPEFTNLPRKFNIAIAGCRDNSIHAEINDIAFVPAFKGETFGFNVLVGGFFSARRCEAAIPLNAWVQPEQVVALCRAILEVYRDNGLRANRQKSRLMWLIDEWGLEKFRTEVERQLGQSLEPEAEKDEILWDKRDHIGIYKQKQPGLNYVGLLVPVGRLSASNMFELARLAAVYGSDEIRLTVEQNVIIPNIPDSRLDTFLTEPLLEKFAISPAPLTRALVSCTGAQFCNFALVETKQRALAVAQELEAELSIPQPVRMHWTGCPNSCGQPQVAEIGLMGTKVRKNGKTLEGVDLYMGGKVGKDARLGTCVRKGIPCEDLKPILREILMEQFGAEPLKGLNGSSVVVAPEHQGEDSNIDQAAKPAIIGFAKSGKEINCSEADSILDVAEQAGIELDSSCRAGNCGTCKQRLVHGEVCYEGEPEALSQGDRQQGYILTCIARPLGRVVLDL